MWFYVVRLMNVLGFNACIAYIKKEANIINK